MIKLTLRKNLIYIIQLFIYYYLRRIVSTIIKQLYNLKDSLIFTLLMLSGELFGGLASYIYQNTFLKKTKSKTRKKTDNLLSKNLSLLFLSKKMNRVDGNFKIILLIFFSAFYDFFEFILVTFFIPNIASLSPTADLRLTSITTISSSLMMTFALKLKIGKHQFYSLLIIGICLVITIIVEMIYQNQVASFGNLFFAYMLTILSAASITFTDIIEKYLTEFNFLNPFLIIVIEAIFGLILVLIYSIGKNPFSEIINLYNEITVGKFLLLIFLLLLHFVFSAGINVYKILSNVFYSPMAKSVSIYVLNPALIIYSYFYDNDFSINGEQNIIYLLINFFLSVIIVFFGFVYNEFFILYCCGLEYETHYIISQRSKNQTEIEISELNLIDRDDNDDEDDDKELKIFFEK